MGNSTENSQPELERKRPAKAERPQSFYDNIKQKFTEERDLRLKLRPEGTAQYTSNLEGSLSRYAVDPLAPRSRLASRSTIPSKCLFIGGGFSALLTSARLRELASRVSVSWSAGADVGGTWYWNRYPGVACDVVAYDYLPLLDEMDYVP